MRKKNLKGVGCLALFVMMAAVAGATPTCASLAKSGALINVALNGLLANSISCTAEGLLFDNFQYAVAGGSGTPQIDLTQNGVGTLGQFLTLNFNPNLGSHSLISDLHFTFTVSGPAVGAYLQNAGFWSSIQEANCVGSEDLNGNCTGGSVIWNTGDPGNQFSSCMLEGLELPRPARTLPDLARSQCGRISN
jgi:hypothetical protein